MTAPTPPPDADRDGAADPSRGPSGGLAGWQKSLGIIGLAVVLVLVILLATGDHGPGRHAPGGSQEQPTDVEDGPGHDPSR